MTILLGLGCVLAALVVVHPRQSHWIGLIYLAVQPFYSPPLLRPLVLGVLFMGMALTWGSASKRQHDVVGYLWLGVMFILTIGWLLAPNPSLAEGMVVNLLYAAAVASLAVILRMTAMEWKLYLMAWGVFVSAWLISQKIVVTGRTGPLYISENANGLGMFAALGLVGAVGLAAGRPLRPWRLLVGIPVIIFCAMGVVSSASRGALLVAAAGVLVQIFAPMFQRSRIRALVSVTLLAICTTWLMVPALTWFVTKAGRNINAVTNFSSREAILGGAFQAGLHHPLSGVGFGSLEVNDAGIYGTVSPHNAYVGLFAATGVLPTILLGILILAALGRARLPRKDSLLPLMVAASAIGLSLDWVPTAKHGPIVLALLACAAALPSGSHDGRVSAQPGDELWVDRHTATTLETGV
jgi:hypothetical protein